MISNVLKLCLICVGAIIITISPVIADNITAIPDLNSNVAQEKKNLFRTPSPIVRHNQNSALPKPSVETQNTATTSSPTTQSPSQSAPTSPVIASQELKETAYKLTNMTVQEHARIIAQTCPKNWENPNCLKASSGASWALSAGYMETLKNAGKSRAVKTIEQECAASTAPAQDSTIPAYAVRSAFTTCANTIADVTEKTGIQPDLSYYQLLGTATMCLTEGQELVCSLIEKQLVSRYAR